MVDWVDGYIDNEGFDSKNRAFSFVMLREIDQKAARALKCLLKSVIRQCVQKEKELNNPNNFKKLKIIVVNEYCFDSFRRLEAKNDSKYEYLILIPKDYVSEQEKLIKRKIAHELAHFLFAIQRKESITEEFECNKKVEEWGF